MFQLPRFRSLPFLGIGALLACCSASGAWAQSITLSMPPGSSESFVLHIANPTANAVHPVAIGGTWSYSRPYVSLTVAAPCEIEQYDSVLITAPIVGPQQSLDCLVTVTHLPGDAISPSATLAFRALNGSGLLATPTELRVGAFAKMSFSLRPVTPLPRTFGDHQDFRLVGRGSDATPLVGGTIETSFLPGDMFSVSGALPGGCSDTVAINMVDFPGSTSQAFELPPIPGGGESSCLLRMSAATGIRADMVRTYYSFAGANEDGFAVQGGGDEFVLRGALAEWAPVPASGRWSIAVLLVGLLAITASTRRFKRG